MKKGKIWQQKWTSYPVISTCTAWVMIFKILVKAFGVVSVNIVKEFQLKLFQGGIHSIICQFSLNDMIEPFDNRILPRSLIRQRERP